MFFFGKDFVGDKFGRQTPNLSQADGRKYMTLSSSKR